MQNVVAQQAQNAQNVHLNRDGYSLVDLPTQRKDN